MEQMHMSIIDYKIRPLIYSQSLTTRKTICPYCKFENPDTRAWELQCLPYWDMPLDTCPNCGKRYEGITEEKSRDLKEVEKLGLTGAVHKDDKGRWRTK